MSVRNQTCDDSNLTKGCQAMVKPPCDVLVGENGCEKVVRGASTDGARAESAFS